MGIPRLRHIQPCQRITASDKGTVGFRTRKRLCREVRRREPQIGRAAIIGQSYGVVHRESERYDALYGFHVRASEIHRNLLPVWRIKTETNGYLDQSSQSEIQTAMQTWGLVPRPDTETHQHRTGDTIAQLGKRAFSYPSRIM